MAGRARRHMETNLLRELCDVLEVLVEIAVEL